MSSVRVFAKLASALSKMSPPMESSDAVFEAILASKQNAELSLGNPGLTLSAVSPDERLPIVIPPSPTKHSMSSFAPDIEAEAQQQFFNGISGFSKVRVEPYQYDMLRGTIQGSMQAFCTILLTPMDNHLKKATATAKTGPVKPCPHGSFNNWEFLLKQNLARNPVMFCAYPIVKGIFQNRGYPLWVSDTMGGLVMGGFDAYLSKKKEVVGVISAAQDKKAVDVEKHLSVDVRRCLEKEAFKWRLGRSLVYNAIMPYTANVIQGMIENPKGHEYEELQRLKQHGDVVHYYFNKGFDAWLSGFLAGYIATGFSYPFEVIKNRATNGKILDCRELIKPIYQCYKEQGIRRVILDHTHKGFFLSSLRMGFAAGFFQLTFGTSTLVVRPFIEAEGRDLLCKETPRLR